MYSDHNLVVAKLRMRSAALNTTGNKPRKVDVLKLRTHSNVQQYKDQLHSNLDNMPSPYKWSDIAAACSPAAETSVGFTKKQTKPWISDSTWKHIENRRLTKNQLHSIQNTIEKIRIGFDI